MRRFSPSLAVPLLGLIALVRADGPAVTPPAAPASASAEPSAEKPPAPPPESLRDLRTEVAHGKLADSAALCDRLAAGYEQRRDAELAQKDKQGYIDSFMAGYCRYVKSQVLSLRGDFPGAQAALAEARDYRAQHAETKIKALAKLWQEFDSVTNGFLLEKQGKLDAAVQVYLQVNESPQATGRLAVLEFKRGHVDQAKTWAYIHADDPTSEYVLAEAAFQKKTYVVAQQHVGRALGQLQKGLATGSEYSPVYFCEFGDLVALRNKLQPLLPKPPPKPAPKPPTPTPKPPAPAATAMPAP